MKVYTVVPIAFDDVIVLGPFVGDHAAQEASIAAAALVAPLNDRNSTWFVVNETGLGKLRMEIDTRRA